MDKVVDSFLSGMGPAIRRSLARGFRGLTALGFLLWTAHPDAMEPRPAPELSPADVVRFQLDALRDNRIDIVFRFASPANKAHTGPLGRFTEMLRSPVYLPMLNHSAAIYGPVREAHGHAYQSVIVVPPGGEAVGYVFVLSKYHWEACRGCWMTDSVARFEPRDNMRGT